MKLIEIIGMVIWLKALFRAGYCLSCFRLLDRFLRSSISE